MSRRVAREELFKLIFEIESNNTDEMKKIVDDYFQRESTELQKDEREFIERYANGIINNIEKIDKTLMENMTGWSLNRIGVVERVLLKIATYEVLFENTASEIVVNEVVELAKKYGDEKSHEFINGVLANVIRNK